MRLCIPTTSDEGLSARLSPHFGSSPYFTIVDTDTNEGEVVRNEHARHEHGRCDPVRSIAGESIDVAICRGLGQRALARLSESGIRVLVTEAWTVVGAVEAYRANTLRLMTPEEACGGHHSHQGAVH